MTQVSEQVVSAIVSETVASLPEEIYRFYQNLPGRNPSIISKSIAGTLSQIDEIHAVELIRDIVDRTVFSILYLVDSGFKDRMISTEFKSISGMQSDSHLVDTYRDQVDPGGVIYRA